MTTKLGVVRRHLYFFGVYHIDEGCGSGVHVALAWALLHGTIVSSIKK